MGFFSEVFQGKWDGRPVAIKVLSEVTPSDLFIREIKVWKGLRHPNVLKLYGASSATGNPPWFFVSPYMKHGNLAEFLRRVSRLDQAELVGLGTIVENLPSSRSRGCFGKGGVRLLKMGDMFRMLQEVARGMEYLHLKGVLHGDLKVCLFFLGCGGCVVDV
jgi:abelson tyrosine-protein kinase 1